MTIGLEDRAGGISLRPALDGDVEFLYRVYASSREYEMSLVAWSDAEKEAFLRMQFEAQHTQYHQMFPGARFDLIERNGEPIGRLYVDRGPSEIRVIDIALLTEYRGGGIGSALMRDLLAEADRTGKIASIHVERFNPALRLYLRLGFREVEDKGIYLFMQRGPRPVS